MTSRLNHYEKMIIGIFSVRNHRYHPNRRLIEAADRLNHHAVLINPKKLYMGMDGDGLRIDTLLGGFNVDVIVPRLGSSIKEYGLSMVRQFELLGIPVVNPFASILLAKNKFLTLQTLSRHGIPVIDSRYASNWSNFEKAVAGLGGLPLVLKALNSRQGQGVFLMQSIDGSRSLLDSLLNTGEGVLIQKFIPPGGRKDIRAFVVGKKVVGAMSLVPKRDDFRANIHLKAKGTGLRLSKEGCALALASTRCLGLDISGVDMIEETNGPLRIVEVNYAPGFKGLEQSTGRDIAAEIIKYAVKAHGRAACRSPF
ncbi:MAG: RimK family alpha-L-glutamate ligase [Pseudomonadota bacterium]